MFTYVSGYSSDEYNNYCPSCGEKISRWHHLDNSATCEKCGLTFIVIEKEVE